jgi:hypothetical protein
LREALLESADEVFEVFERQVGVQAAYDVELGHGLGVSTGGRLKRFFERHGVAAGRVFTAAKGAQAAGGDADVRGIDVVGQPADAKNVWRAVERDAVVEAEAFAAEDFVGNGREPLVVKCGGGRSGRDGLLCDAYWRICERCHHFR